MRYGHVVVGGTFDYFHRGHIALIKRAVELGGFVTIGVTSNRFAGRSVEPYEVRKAAVEGFVETLGCEEYTIVKLEDPFGPAANDPSMEALVVSDETFERALELNRIRRKAGLKELEIIKVPMIYAEDGGSLSSSRIRKGEIDREGRIK
ncbi:MAG: phosphopantetheine adenylyltransferase [Candidatus Hydrothermarchaeales archaeon]